MQHSRRAVQQSDSGAPRCVDGWARSHERAFGFGAE